MALQHSMVWSGRMAQVWWAPALMAVNGPGGGVARESAQAFQWR